MTIDKAQLKALAEAFPSDLDWDSNTEPFFNGPSGESLGGGSTGFFSVYGQPFEIDGEQYDGTEYVSICTRGFAEFVCVARSGVLDLLSESDQLKAELAGLRTGYDAQNNVIAGLKAESEALRYDIQVANSVVLAEKKDAERYRWLRVESRSAAELDAAFNAYGVPMDEAIDAAMAKDGVQIKAHSDPVVSDLTARIDYLEKDNASLRGSCAALGKKLTEATRNLRSAQRTLSWLMFNREISTEGMPKWVLNRFKRLIKYQDKPVE